MKLIRGDNLSPTNKAEVLREVQDALAKAEVLRSLRSRLHVP